ncbi:MAG: hypothetical protein QNJ75_07985 [Acidimicrobiia bacterium]|nr:hypothetical protein [Acidimicrobiia bacterium]
MTKAETHLTQPVAPGPIADPATLAGQLAEDVWERALRRLGDPALAAAAAELAWRRFARNAHFEGVSNPREWLQSAVDGEVVRLAKSLGAVPQADEHDYQAEVVSTAGRVLAETQPQGAFARIIYDSFSPTARSAFLPLRSSGAMRMLSFEAGESVIDLSIEPEGGAATLMGVVAPPPERKLVELVRRGDRVGLDVETDGRFRAGSLESGPLSIAVPRPHQPMITDWFSV